MAASSSGNIFEPNPESGVGAKSPTFLSERVGIVNESLTVLEPEVDIFGSAPFSSPEKEALASPASCGSPNTNNDIRSPTQSPPTQNVVHSVPQDVPQVQSNPFSVSDFEKFAAIDSEFQAIANDDGMDNQAYGVPTKCSGGGNLLISSAQMPSTANRQLQVNSIIGPDNNSNICKSSRDLFGMEMMSVGKEKKRTPGVLFTANHDLFGSKPFDINSSAAKVRQVQSNQTSRPVPAPRSSIHVNPLPPQQHSSTMQQVQQVLPVKLEQESRVPKGHIKDQRSRSGSVEGEVDVRMSPLNLKKSHHGSRPTSLDYDGGSDMLMPDSWSPSSSMRKKHNKIKKSPRYEKESAAFSNMSFDDRDGGEMSPDLNTCAIGYSGLVKSASADVIKTKSPVNIVVPKKRVLTPTTRVLTPTKGSKKDGLLQT